MSSEKNSNSGTFRVLMVAPTSFFADYGCHVRILEEAQALQRLGHSVTIATYQNGGPVAGLDIRRSLPVPGRRTFEVGSGRHKVAFDALLGIRILTLLARQRFDVIHGHLHEGALMGLVLGRLFRVPTVFDFQGSMTGEMLDHGFLRRNGRLYAPLVRLETWIDRRSPVIFTSSTNARNLLLKQFGCRAEQVITLPDAVHSAKFRPAATYDPAYLAELREKVGIPAGRKLIVYLGLLAEYQGTGLLLQAMARLVARRQDVHLLLMGFPNVERYGRQADQLGIAPYVTLTGRMPYEQAPEMLALGDVAVSTKLSLTEGAGKLLNYMAVGLPTVAFDTPVAREYLGKYGVLASAGDVEDLAERLDQVLFPSPTDAALLQAGARLRARALERYRWDTVAQQITHVYAKLTGITAPNAPRLVDQPSKLDQVGIRSARPGR